MRIVFLSRYQNTSNRGVETFIKELTARLSKDHEVKVLTGADADDLRKIIKGKFDVVVPTNGRLQSLKVSLGRLIGGYKQSLKFSLRSNYKVLISGHSGIGRDDIWNIVLGKPDVFVALTDYMADWAKKWAWGSKVVKICNGIDLNKFKPEGEKMEFGLPKPVILSVGALTWYKHHERVIEAVAKLGKGSVLIVGKGEDKEKLEILGKEKLGENFKLASSPYEDLPKIYRRADLFTLPSWEREAFGIVYLEAMASGLPVVAPDDLSRKEIVGDAGILVDTKDIEKYADAINKALQAEWNDKPRKQAEKFSWDIISKKYEDILKELANG